MTSAQIKAKELVDKFIEIIDHNDAHFDTIKQAKQCALIAISEIKNVCPYIDENKRETDDQFSAFDFQFISYWEKVQKEIEKL